MALEASGKRPAGGVGHLLPWLGCGLGALDVGKADVEEGTAGVSACSSEG